MVPPSLRVQLLAGLVAGLFLLGCGSAAPSEAGPFAEAHTSAQSWWPKAEAAFISGDPTALSDLYAESALDVAKGQMQMALLLGTRPKYARPFRDSAIFLPPAGTNANWFLAIVRYAPVDQDGRAGPVDMSAPGMIFSNISRTWKVIATDVQAPITHGLLSSNDSTFSAPLNDSRYLLPRSTVAPAYAAYLNSLSAGQQADVPFPTGLNSFAWQFTRVAWPPSSIATAHFSFEVETLELAEYSISSGTTKVPEVVLFVLRRTVVMKPRQGCLVKRQGDLWSAAVPTGSYSAASSAEGEQRS